MSRLIGDHIKAVIFDFDDTLVGTIEAKWAAHKYIARKHYGKELTDAEIRQHWGKPLRALVGLLYGDEDLDRASAFEEATHRDFPKKIFEDTLDVLAAFREVNKYIGTVTAASRASLITDLEIAQIPESFFDYMQTQEDTEFHKPDLRVFDPLKEWLGTISIHPQEAVYVGDGLHDMHAALGAGFEFIGVTTGLVTQAEFHANNVPSIPRLGDLVGL